MSIGAQGLDKEPHAQSSDHEQFLAGAKNKELEKGIDIEVKGLLASEYLKILSSNLIENEQPISALRCSLDNETHLLLLTNLRLLEIWMGGFRVNIKSTRLADIQSATIAVGIFSSSVELVIAGLSTRYRNVETRSAHRFIKHLL